jgi:hypothetical protein
VTMREQLSSATAVLMTAEIIDGNPLNHQGR